MKVPDDGTAVSKGGIPGRKAYDPDGLKSFSKWGTWCVGCGLAHAAVTFVLALAYGHRLLVIRDLRAGTATVGQLRTADTLADRASSAALLVAIPWVLVLFQWLKASHRLVGINLNSDPGDKRRQFKQIISEQPDWSPFGSWLRLFWAYAALGVLRFLFTNASAATLDRLESLNRRALIITAVDVVLGVVIAVVGWRAKRAVEMSAQA